MRRILVTGGGGFLGSKICRQLSAHGEEVVVLGRRRYPHLESGGLEIQQADICNAEAVRKACAGIDLVVHTAALTGIWGNPVDFWSVNFEGTRNVLAACRHHHIRRLVYTSSPSVVFNDHEICGADESLPYPDHFSADYPASKAAAEKLVLQANDAEMATIALRPHLLWGPGDPHIIPRIIIKARTGQLCQVGEGENLVDITYVDNAAEAHCLAVDRLEIGAPCSGRAYFISQGEPVKLWNWINQLLTRLRLPVVRKKMSYRNARMMGSLLEWWYRLRRKWKEPPMTRFLANQLAQSHYFDISASRRDLDYKPKITTEQGLEQLVAELWARFDRPRRNTL